MQIFFKCIHFCLSWAWVFKNNNAMRAQCGGWHWCLSARRSWVRFPPGAFSVESWFFRYNKHPCGNSTPPAGPNYWSSDEEFERLTSKIQIPIRPDSPINEGPILKPNDSKWPATKTLVLDTTGTNPLRGHASMSQQVGARSDPPWGLLDAPSDLDLGEFQGQVDTLSSLSHSISSWGVFLVWQHALSFGVSF